ncbi:hypothetical protein Pth03_08900 [Planotetraspora thailandica]|uniref:Cell division protein DivIVA n=1 Tax=Planotetraspora thailandica TaxID=487172 RepID=A0A8J3UZX1_9ACTN|nr:hypothetical protein [Planotetraspora thailandica]GII52501.1 hypothetical protein Pth03_08900 [Planotetraspora thailandica]
MTNQTENFPDLMSDDSFEVVMRGYSRRQVHDYMIRTRNQIRDLEERLARTIDQAEQSRIELAEARRKMTESPQNPDELGERLSQILKLAQEEATANKEASQSEAARVRENAGAEAERLVLAAREQAESIRAAAQEEAERRVADATASAERLLSQAGSDAEETLGTARAEAEDTVRTARAEADRLLTTARLEAERQVNDANAAANAALAAAEQRVSALDEHTGRRVVYLTDTHTEVMRRLNEIGSVLGDLLGREASAGPLIDEAAVVPPALQLGPLPPAVLPAREFQPVIQEDVADEPEHASDSDEHVAVPRQDYAGSPEPAEQDDLNGYADLDGTVRASEGVHEGGLYDDGTGRPVHADPLGYGGGHAAGYGVMHEDVRVIMDDPGRGDVAPAQPPVFSPFGTPADVRDEVEFEIGRVHRLPEPPEMFGMPDYPESPEGHRGQFPGQGPFPGHGPFPGQ